MLTHMGRDSTGSHDCEMRWEQRVRRARELCDQHPSAAPVLRFYVETLGFQAQTARGSSTASTVGIPLREQIDASVAASGLPNLLNLAIEQGPEILRSAARQLRDTGKANWRNLLESAIHAVPNTLAGPDDFFARACLQPLAENLQMQFPPVPYQGKSTCPVCGGLPQMSVLRPEGEGAARSLLCSFCLHEWPFRRLACPWCEEENKEKLPGYSAQEFAHVRVEACDTCKRYLKAVDMTINGLAVPLVDEAALAVLDVWAVEHGYCKIVCNLIGF